MLRWIPRNELLPYSTEIDARPGALEYETMRGRNPRVPRFPELLSVGLGATVLELRFGASAQPKAVAQGLVISGPPDRIGCQKRPPFTIHESRFTLPVASPLFVRHSSVTHGILRQHSSHSILVQDRTGCPKNRFKGQMTPRFLISVP